MLVRVLGTAAGGGYPQWNCRCAVCAAAREGRASARLQSALAVRGAEGPWFLVNASPDVHRQLASLPANGAPSIRSMPVDRILLTDAELDHVAGLLLLRESGSPLRVLADARVRRALTDDFPVARVLDAYCGIDWRDLGAGAPVRLPSSSLVVESAEAGGGAPRYAASSAPVALTFRDDATGGVLTYAPAVACMSDALRDRLGASDAVLVDGTFWDEHELRSLGISARSASRMGHLPLSGDDGMLAILRPLRRPRKLLVHINNTNPVLVDDSRERDEVRAGGVEVPDDGAELKL